MDNMRSAMRLRNNFPLPLSLVLIYFLILSASPILAIESPATEESGDCFVDLDGDGLDDNRIDFRNGFYLDDSAPTVLSTEVVNPFADMAVEAAEELLQTPKEEFTSRRFNARAICQSRRDFDGDFGSSESGSSSSGSHCVGGVCF